MDGACLRYTELPGTSRLFADYLYDFGKVSQFYRHAPRKAESFKASVASLHDYPDARREAIVAALRKINPGSANIDKLAQPGTVAVVTGQQVGLFTGPAYTIFKAVTAAAVARQLSEDGIPAVPVFWLATEDHDFPEVASAHVYDHEAGIHTLKVWTSGAPDRPVGGIVPEEGYPLGELEQVLAGFPHTAEVMQLLREAHTANPTMGGAFRHTLQRLLHSLDLVYIDPLDPAIRAIGAPLIRDAIERHDVLHKRLLDRNQELAAAGYHAQVHVEAENSLFFTLEGGRRVALKLRKDGMYATKERTYTTEQLTAHAESISPNAILRPVLQDFLLPTVAYVGGPAELAYLAQSEVAYSELLGRMPVMLPRNGFTLLSARTQKLLDRYGFTLPGALIREEELRAIVAAKLLPDTLHDLFAQSGQELREVLDRIGSRLHDFDPSLAKALNKSRAKMTHQLSKIEQKTAREALRRDQRASAEAFHLSNMLFPEEHLQERFFSILPFVAQYGTGVIDHIVQHSCIDCVDHHVLPV